MESKIYIFLDSLGSHALHAVRIKNGALVMG